VEALAGRFPVLTLGDQVDRSAGAFMDTAAILKNLDLLVGIDTAVAHLAGGLGVPAWLAVHYTPEWRWLLGRDDNPWYPTVRLFRQPAVGDWQAVFARLADALRELAPRRRPLLVEVSPGELLDKLTGLQAQGASATAMAPLAASRAALGNSAELAELTTQLQAAHEQLCQVEEGLRACEREQDCGQRFVDLARSARRANERRAYLRKAIDELLQWPVSAAPAGSGSPPRAPGSFRWPRS
jgi:hypothetical protein